MIEGYYYRIAKLICVIAFQCGLFSLAFWGWSRLCGENVWPKQHWTTPAWQSGVIYGLFISAVGSALRNFIFGAGK